MKVVGSSDLKPEVLICQCRLAIHSAEVLPQNFTLLDAFVMHYSNSDAVSHSLQILMGNNTMDIIFSTLSLWFHHGFPTLTH